MAIIICRHWYPEQEFVILEYDLEMEFSIIWSVKEIFSYAFE